jgi:hypothetical protein
MTHVGDVSQFSEVDARYVAARRVLLDALTALAPHGDAVILAGAQAIYLHTAAPPSLPSLPTPPTATLS